MADYDTFPCPACGQFVNNSMTVCKFCSVPFDQDAVDRSMRKQKKLNEAYRSASNTRILAGAMTTAFFLGFLPFVGFVTTWVFRGMFVCIPILLIIWLVKYSDLSKEAQEIKDARKYLFTAFGIWLIYPVIFIIFNLFVLGLLKYQLSK